MAYFTYEIKIKCENCGFKSTLKVKKGTSVTQFIETIKCRCKQCGCPIEPKEYETQWLK